MELQNKIAELEAEQNKTTPVIDHKEKPKVLRYALEQYTNFDDDGDPNDPLHLKTEGKRRKSTTIIDPNKQTACEPVRDTGCYQRI